MIIRFLVPVFIFLSFSAAAQKSVTTVGRVTGNSFKFVIDTIAYKNFVSTKLSDSGSEVVFDKIEIRKQMTLGSKKEFFYLLLTSKDKEVSVARWLTRIKDNFVTNDERGEDDLFEQIYLICMGGGACSPNVFEDKGVRMWGCSEVLGCNAVEGQEPKCITSQSIF